MKRRKPLTNTAVSKLKPADKPYEVRDASFRGLLLRVQPSGTMTYYFEYARGKRIKIGDGNALAPDQARDIARPHAVDYSKGLDPIQKRKQVKAENYLQFLKDTYVPWLRANKPKTGNEIYGCLVKTFPEFHGLGLNEITPWAIEKWKQRRSGEGIKASSINRQLNDLQACLNRAVKWGALTNSPFDKVERPKIDSSPKTRFLSPKEELSLRKALDDREAKKKAERQSANLWRSERNYPLKQEYCDYLKPAVLLSINTGLRLSELFSLKNGDINFEQRVLTVAGDTSKTGKTRHVPLSDEALIILKRLQKQPGVRSLWVLHDKDGQPIRNPRVAFVEVLRKAKITNFRWHDLRHSFASKLAMSGVDLYTISQYLGHSDAKMTQRYSHLSADHKAAAIKKLVPAVG